MVVYTDEVLVQHTVDELGRYDGKHLRDLLPLVVSEIVAFIDPVEVIVFGSIGRGDESVDSDIDLLVVLDYLDREHKRSLMLDIRRSIKTFAPVDVFVADRVEIAEGRDKVGSMLYWPLREGRRVYVRKGAGRHSGSIFGMRFC